MSRVVVLYGGASAEREVSLVSGQACAAALGERGHEVRLVDPGRDVGALVEALTPPPDVVFNALHGRYGEDGTVQGLLELMGLKYTHSGPLASALAMNKAMAKKVFEQAGIRTVDGFVMSRRAMMASEPMERPYVVKPLAEGSSVGVQIVTEDSPSRPYSSENWPYGDEVLVERFVPGRELTVAVMADRPLAVTEIRPKDGFYDYRHKYTGGVTDHIIPAPIDPRVYEEAMNLARKAHQALGCRGVSRADFRYDDTGGEPGVLYLLEVNTQPGMTELSLVPEQAEHVGVGFGELVEWMLREASCDG